ncbi:MAG: UDP-glucose/GDP-mannose dehydrogenase family protein [Parvibaculaceae bacterium]|nr:UDP-glucose/GDP-mannose dehydrogenase family protein [Parvibaculaceae bacterium]
MRIAMIGTGYVGLVSGACFADFGHEVVCIDKDASKIERLKKGEIPIYEPGLDVLVNGNRFAGRLSFTTDLAEGMKGAQAIFIAVGTPSRRGDGHADLSYVYAASEEIADLLEDYTVIVTKSTVPVGTGDKIEELIRNRRPDADFDVASNPEFLREGSAIEDFKRPDRVVVGAETERALDVLRQLYRPLNLNETPMLCTQRRTSELTKYAANAFLATKITFINEIADLCESVGADVQQVAKGIGLDGRIGSKFLHAGPGYGGSCFPKDTLALLKTAEDFSSPMNIVKATVETNNNRKIQMAQKVLDAIGDVKGKKLAILGVTFKPNTDDMRDAPSLDIIPALQKAGALVHAYDPEGMEEAKPLLPDVHWETNAQDTLRDAEALVILTEWNEFRALDLSQIKEMLARPLIIDLRNIYAVREMQDAGIAYHSIGRPAV